MQNILVPTDFSEAANTAIDYAIMLASQEATPTNIDFLNSYFVQEELALFISEQHIEKLSRHQLFDLIYEERSKNLPTHIKFDGTIKRGTVVPTIIAEAKEKDINLIVIGKNGACCCCGKEKTGSTPIGLIKNSTIPTIIIPKNNPIKPPKRIALAIDDRYVDVAKTLPPLFKLLDQLGAELILLHVEKEEKHLTAHSSTQQQLNQQGYPCPIYKMDSDYTSDALLALAKQHKADLLVTIHHHNPFWDDLLHHSTSADVAHQVALPLMVLHDND